MVDNNFRVAEVKSATRPYTGRVRPGTRLDFCDAELESRRGYGEHPGWLWGQ